MRLVWLAAWLFLYQPPHKNRLLRREEYDEMKNEVRPPEETTPAKAGSVDWRRVIRMRECYTLIIARFFTDPVIYFIIFWLPEYLRKERHFDLAMVGKYAWVPFIFGGIAYVLGGWLSGWLMRRGWPLLVLLAVHFEIEELARLAMFDERLDETRNGLAATPIPLQFAVDGVPRRRSPAGLSDALQRGVMCLG